MKRNIIFKAVFLFAVSMILISSVYASPVHLKLATTTSTENSGLLGVLLPPFEEKFGIKVDVIAVGTGKALTLGENGDVDLVLVHARAAEDKFIGEGYGVNRRDVMYNDFIILGPSDDPAEIKGESNVILALKKIAGCKAYFMAKCEDFS